MYDSFTLKTEELNTIKVVFLPYVEAV